MSTETDHTPRPTPGRNVRPGPRAGGPPGGPRPYTPGGMRGRRPMLRQRRCRICEERRGNVDWKAVNFLRNFVSDRGKIVAGRAKGFCAPCQRNLGRAIRRARDMALLPTSPV